MSELTGRTIGQYQLIEEKSETANSLVYKAFQPALNRYVAVKILKPSSARQPETVQRFRQQGDLLAQLHHPRLIEVYETGEATGNVFQAMRLAENGSLRDQLAAGVQSPFYQTQRAVLLFQEIVEGLEFIHSQGYIHGNITPNNILLDDMLHPLLSDFGLPGRVNREITPYLAPEQVQGGMVDRRTDVYALGVLLFTTLVSAEPPAGVVVSPRSRRPDLPESVERVIFKAMAQNPDQRFQSGTEFSNALRTAFATPPPAPQPVYAPPPPPTVAPLPTVSQTINVTGQKKGANWVAIILGVLLVLILCVGAMTIYQVYLQNQSVTPGAPTQPVEQPTQAPPIIILPSQPPAVTQVLPTKESRPTNEPRPTQPPNQPTNPPEQPTQPPALRTQPPQVEQPVAPPAQATPGTGFLPCGSVGLIVAPMLVLGASRLKKKYRP